MGLPPYTGPFKVGVLDLEIPVRKPRSFCSNVVEPGVLNKPAAKARRWAKKQNKEAKESRKEKEREADSAASPAQSPSSAEAGPSTSTVNASNADASTSDQPHSTAEGNEQPCGSCGCPNDDENDSEEADTPWSPWSTGSKTCTLHLETVLFTIYYPTLPMPDSDFKRYPRAAWLGRPVHAGVRALFQYIGQYGPFALPLSPIVTTLISARLPARVGPPLADPEELRRRADPSHANTDRAATGNFGARPPQFPVVIFSHGLAGNRLSYSQYCGELASQGIIVAAIEHRDGSGVSSIVRGEEAPGHANRRGFHIHKPSGRMKASVPYFTFESIGLQSFAPEPSEREVNLRRDQIEMRHAEIEETFWVLSEINAGRGYEIVRRSTRSLGTKLAGHSAAAGNTRLPVSSVLRSERPLEDWKGKLDMDFPTLCGHSFGGATVIELMRRENPFPIALVLDPWVEPVRDPSEQEHKVHGTLAKPLYVLNSESFTVWEEHFDKLKRICLDARKTSGRGWLLTLTGSKHTDFSDYPFLLPKIFRSTVGPKHTIEVFSKATYMQMGLSRQRWREQEDAPGLKVDRQGSVRDGAPNLDEEVGNQADSDATATETTKIVTSPTSLDDNTISITPLPSEDQSNTARRGKIMPSQTVVQSPICEVEQGGNQIHRVNAHVDAHEGSATSATTSQTQPRSPEAASSAANCASLREESQTDTAAMGAEAREMAGAVQRATSIATTPGLATARQKGFITDLKYLQMIDADADVQQVHERLEQVADRFKDKKTRPRSLMSVFMYMNGFKPGLDRPGKVLIHQLNSSHPPK
ncbi:Platelet-activating factor acetylhydrolase [Kalmanozyma brasiliensis GHG001]|uniref:1-alkyl-2-acetylglycerophosphocholine esterase n=1 Tax=Kalmanozyma brasiliensis (strain GHG001) TaxID=1365824 RepID=V5GV27_KALBG|nr:Platelet-activating factor acetylhydrolase [Kalmanozyma brasiliensis GHG001]EST09762.1 Platelet-activating factor acetylhydrolase [Kalmanozyma brasiliensis GHG001]